MADQINPDQTQPMGDLQFDRAEYPTMAESSPQCSACKQSIVGEYYSIGQQLICPACRGRILAQTTGGSRIARLSRALLFGIGASIVAGAIWWGITKATGYQIGLIAVVVGFLVGSAVRAGARGRGGMGYQLLAVALTYSCIVSTYIPDVYQGLRESAEKDDRIAATQPAQHRAVAKSGAKSAPANLLEEERAERAEQRKNRGILGKIGAALLLGVILFVIAAVAPILAGFQNIIGLLIIGFALWEAWKINRRVKIPFAGPFAMNMSAPAVAGQAPSSTTSWNSPPPVQ